MSSAEHNAQIAAARAEHKAKIAAARAARNEAGVNMFNPEVNIKPIPPRNTGPISEYHKAANAANKRRNNANNAITRGTTQPGANGNVYKVSLNLPYQARRFPETYYGTNINKKVNEDATNAIRKKTINSIPMKPNNSGNLIFTVINPNTGTLKFAHEIGKKHASGNFTPINNRSFRPWISSIPNFDPVEEVGSSGCLGGTCNPQKKGWFWGGRRKSRKNKKSKKSKSRKNKKRRTYKRHRV